MISKILYLNLPESATIVVVEEYYMSIDVTD